MTTQITATQTAQAGSPGFASMIDGDIVRRAALIALVIGSALTLGNQSAAIFGNEEFGYMRLLLAYMTPFAVVAISQLQGVRQAMIDGRQNGDRRLGEEMVLATILAHGISLRAALVSVVAGSINALAIMATFLMDGASLNSLPVVVIAQAYALPMVFSLLSQTIVYRRAIQTFNPRSVTANAGQFI